MTVLALGQRDLLRQEGSSITATATHQVPTHFDNAPAIRQTSIVLTTAKNGGVQKCLLVNGEDEIVSLGFHECFVETNECRLRNYLLLVRMGKWLFPASDHVQQIATITVVLHGLGQCADLVVVDPFHPPRDFFRARDL